MFLKVYSFQGIYITTLKEFLDFQVEKKLSAGGKTSFTVHRNATGLNADLFKLHNKLERLYVDCNDVVHTVWVGYITKIIPSNIQIEFEGEDLVAYMQDRRLREDFTAFSVLSTGMTQIYNYLNTIYPLPFTLGTIENVYALDFKLTAGLSLYDIIKKLSERNFEFRIWNGKLDIATTQTGVTLPGVYKYNSENIETSNIVSWRREYSLDEFYNATISRNKNNATPIQVGQDNVSLSAYMLVDKFGYNPEGHNTATKGTVLKYPSVVIDANTEDRWTIQVGDRKQVYIYDCEYDFLSFNFVSAVLSIKIKANGGMYDVSIELGESNSTNRITGIDSIFEKINTKVSYLQTYSN